jgi:hypothetical protein
MNASGQMTLALGDDTSTRRRRWPRTLFFASGSNSPGEIRGFASLGIPVGFCAAVIGKSGIAELERHAATGLPVFGDTGAYSEVTIAGAKPVHTKPITDQEWARRLRLLTRIAAAFGPRFVAAAPDFVGDQGKTLHRLVRYRDEIRGMASEGSEVMVALHRGVRSLTAFHAEAEAALGIEMVPAFPMLKCATSTTDLIGFAATNQPRRIHLLGIGLRSPRARDLLPLLHRVSSETLVSMDSNLITAAVGRRKDGSAARALTVAQDAIHDGEIRNTYREIRLARWAIFLDYTEAITAPSSWLSPSGRKRVASEAGLSTAQARRWVRDPDEFLHTPLGFDAGSEQTICWWEHPCLAFALDHAWSRYTHRALANVRRAAAIRTCFQSHPAAGQFAPADHLATCIMVEGQ